MDKTSRSSQDQLQPRKLVLKMETLRQLTNRELRSVAGGPSNHPTCDSDGNSCLLR